MTKEQIDKSFTFINSVGLSVALKERAIGLIWLSYHNDGYSVPYRFTGPHNTGRLYALSEAWRTAYPKTLPQGRLSSGSQTD